MLNDESEYKPMKEQTNPKSTRRKFVKNGTIGVSTAAFFGAATVTGSAHPNEGRSESANGPKEIERAEAAYEALQQYFYQEESGLYLEQYPKQEDDNPYSYVWPFSQALAATIDLSGVRKAQTGQKYTDDVEDRLSTLENYWNPEKKPVGYDSYVRAPYGEGGDHFYDDNEWIGLEMIQHYRMTGDKAALKRARQIFDLVVYGWDDDDSHPCPGGVFWTQASWNNDRNTVSTAPGAELGLHLYQLSNSADDQEYYFNWSKRMYDWVNECMRAPNGLYWDHIDLDGNITEWIFTYNQGTMIGASVLLYEITGDRSYLNRARDITNKAIEYFKKNDRLYEEDLDFTSIFFKNILLLQNIDYNPKYTSVIEEFADRIWEEDRDPETNIIKRGDTGSPTHLLRQSAFVQINASLAWIKADFDELA